MIPLKHPDQELTGSPKTSNGVVRKRLRAYSGRIVGHSEAILRSRKRGVFTFNPAAIGIQAFRPTAPRRLGRPIRPCPTRSTKRA